MNKRDIENALRHHGKQQGLKGAGLISFIKDGYNAIRNFLSGTRLNFSPRVRAFLKKHGDDQILSMQVGRRPIFSMIEKIASVLSAGRYDANKEQLNYDKMFHLFLVIQLPTTIIKIEKNHVIELTYVNHVDITGEYVMVPPSRDLTLNELLSNAMKIVSREDFFRYSAYSTNCQHFISTLLKGSDLMTPELNNFIMQDAEQVLDGLPQFRNLADTVTGLAGRLDHAIYGGKAKPKRKRKLKK